MRFLRVLLLFAILFPFTLKAQDTVHVVFETHLDIGFTDFAPKVIKKYFNEFIPNAVETANVLEYEGGSDKFVWTTGWWILWEYLIQATPKETVA